jgi:PAS domain S-box-containing protein
MGRTTYPLAGESQAAFVLAHSEPVVVEYWPDETRFAPPPLLAEHGVLSSIIAPLYGRAAVSGYLGIHTRTRRAFTPGDVSFVQSMAHLLGQVIGRAQAEEAARLSERRVRLALGTAPVAVFGQDRDLRILWMVNADPRVIAAYGELAGLPERVLYADEREYALSAAFKQRVMETRQPGRQEMTVTFVGIRRVYAVTAEPTFDEDGAVSGVICASMDITELKETQARLEESEARFRTALQNTPITVFQQDRDLRYTWVYNPVLGGPPTAETIVGKSDHELVSNQEELAALVAFKQRVLETRQAQRAELVLTFDRPHSYNVTAEPLLDERGEVTGLTAAAFDLTELREARVALAESEEMRRLALEAAELGTLAYDPATGKLFADARCRAIFGVGADEPFSLKRAFSLIHPDDLERAQATYARVTAPDGHAAFTEELRIVRPEGALRWINVRGRAHDAEGPGRRVEQLVGIVMDVTERKRAEEALREWSAALERSVAERTAELQQRNEELDRFAYVASHDLKSPLRGIRLLAQWVQEDAHGALPPAAREHLEKLVGRVDRMERLLDDLLLYSRAGRTREHAEELDFAAFVGDVVETLEVPAGFTISVPEGSAPRILAERVPLELALRNLIGNAIKHHHRPDAGHAWVGAQDAGSAWLVTVRDDGPGIDPAFHARIFDMFQTLRPRDQVEGSGMGLALVRKLAETRGGRVEVASAAKAGTEFRLWWPKDSG